ADREERRVAQVEQSGEPDDDVQADRKQDVHPRVGDDADQEVARATGRDLGPDGVQDRRDQQERVDERVWVDPRVGLPDLADRPEDHHVQRTIYFSGTRIPRIPVGRKMSTSTRIAKMSTWVHAVSK